MDAYRVEGREGLASLKRVDLSEPVAGDGEVVVEVRAASLNYRDLGILRGGYKRNDTNPVVPLSDGAGVVASVGPNVGDWAVGDRVTMSFVQEWIDGPPTDAALGSSLGGGRDGVLRRRMAVPATGLVRTPALLSDAEAACLPCAGVTAWQALFEHRPLQTGETVLLLGTGGVSMFAQQLATAAGANVVQTTSSEEKRERLHELGVSQTVNYRTHPDWATEVRSLTGGRGADHIVEVGGPGTLSQSIRAAAVGGQIALIGVLEDPEAAVHPLPLLFELIRVQGIYVGSRVMLERLVDFLSEHTIRPHIDRTFGFDDAAEAFRYFRSQQHMGKVVIDFAAGE